MNVYSISINPAYSKSNGAIVFKIDEVKSKVPFLIQYEAIISIPPTAFGGNHKHPRAEAFFTLHNELEIVWEDQHKKIHREVMVNEHVQKLFVVEANVPHMIINRSTTNSATLIEFADGPQIDVTLQDLQHDI